MNRAGDEHPISNRLPGVRRRFLLLVALRWLPTGLLIPVSLLLPLQRGLTVTEIGAALAAQGIVVLLLEVPTGALTDAWGRRPVFVASGAAAISAYALTMVAQDLPGFVLAWAISGVFRALDSGPLEAWFVDAENARGAAAEVPSGLAAAGGVISAAIATGSVATAGFLWVSPWSASASLALPYSVAMVVVAAQIGSALWLMETAPRSSAPTTAGWRSALASGVRVALGPSLRMLVVAMVLIGVGVATLEMLMPVRLDEFSADTSAAGTVMGVVTAVAWGLAALGAAVASRVLRTVAPGLLAPGLLAVQAVGLVVMAVAVGPVALIAGFWLGYLVHSAFAASYNAIVHARVDDARRGTALSVTSMAFLGSAVFGGVLIGAVADRASTAIALAVGAGFLAVAAALVAVGARTRPSTLG